LKLSDQLRSSGVVKGLQEKPRPISPFKLWWLKNGATAFGAVIFAAVIYIAVLFMGLGVK